MTVKKQAAISRYIGLAADSKPTSVPVGSTFFEYDTKALYITYDGTNWSIKGQGLEQSIEKSDGGCLSGQDSLFTITGGPIIVTEFVGIVTDTIGANAANCHIDLAVTAPAADTALSTNVAITDDAIGTSYTFSVASPGVLTPTTAGVLMVIPRLIWLCPIGTIKSHCSAANTGNIKWYMVYKPLSPNSVVVAAA